eukprot:4171672-Pleurochrysis_carterae.AAC.2
MVVTAVADRAIGGVKAYACLSPRTCCERACACLRGASAGGRGVRLTRSNLLEAEWDAQLVLVLEDDGVLGLEGGVRANGAEQKHEARELARARREGEGVARLAFERVRQVRVQVALARKEHARRRRQTEAHRRRRRGGAAQSTRHRWTTRLGCRVKRGREGFKSGREKECGNGNGGRMWLLNECGGGGNAKHRNVE